MMLRRFASLLAATIVLAAAGPAPAQERPRDEAIEREWYGWQSAGLGTITGLVFAAGLATDQDALATSGAIAFAFASPLSHWLRGDTGEGVAALALNAGLPLFAVVTLGLPGALIDRCDGNDCVTYPWIAGMAIAMAIDAAALSTHEQPRGPFLQAGLAPFVAPGDRQLVVGMTWTS